MPPTLRVPLVVAFGVWYSVVPGVSVVSDTTRLLPHATVVAPADPTTTYHVRDRDGRMVTVDVPPLGSPAVQVNDPTQGTVEATVLAIDGETNQVTVRTQAGHTLVLTLTPEAVTGLRVGEHCTLSIVQRSWQ
jgi:hypothetical protein